MRALRRRPALALGAVLAVAALVSASASSASADDRRGSGTRLYVPAPDPGSLTQIKTLLARHDRKDAALIGSMVTTPQAVWLTSGTPTEVKAKVAGLMRSAARQRAVPVLVAYDIPYRDCSQYSSGGAVDQASYLAWIDGLAAGIGRGKAIVLLEPDSLGIIPFNIDLNGNPEWCQPKDASGKAQPGADPASRYAELNGAVTRLKKLPNVKVYLDGTNSAWLSAGDIAHRLVQAGVQKTDGFFLNVSNYRLDAQSTKYGTWISGCIAYANDPAHAGAYANCASQYYPANPDDFSTWGQTDAWYAANLGKAVPKTHFVIDTSRSGRGPNLMSGYAAAPYNQPASVVSALKAANWCNPPGAGAGRRPTTRTGVALLDAYLWVKTPGQSDGSCDIAGGARAWDYTAYNPWGLSGDAGNHFDPLWGQVDPAAGAWFPAQALQLAQLAVPALLPRH